MRDGKASGDGHELPRAQGWSARLRRHLPLVLIALCMAIAFHQGWHRLLSLETLAARRELLAGFVDAHFLVSLGAYFLLYVLIVALSVPGASVMTLAGGLLFGWALGGAVTVVAATIGAVVIFLIARSSLGAGLAGRAGGVAGKMAAGFRDDALGYMLFLRLVPVFPFWLVNLAPALLGVPLGIYALGTCLGIIPGTLAFTFVGAGLDSVLDAQMAARRACLQRPDASAADCPFTFDLSGIITPELLVALVLLGVAALIPALVKRYFPRGRAGK